MIKTLLTTLALLLVAGCGGGSSGGPTTPDNSSQGTPTGTGNTGSPTPVSGGTTTVANAGNIYIGSSTFGPSVFVIDDNNNLFGFSANGAGKYESIFGNVTSTNPMIRFEHRDSENLSFGDGYTIVGDPIPGSETIDLNLTVTNDGQTLQNTGGPGAYSLMLADNNDLAPLDVADVVGTWITRNAFCPTNCEQILEITFAADGGVTGFTQFTLTGNLAAGDKTTLTGTVNSAGQYLTIQFERFQQTLTGVIYRDSTTSNIVLNASGLETVATGDRSFSALLTRQ